jgi:hypothetical protein
MTLQEIIDHLALTPLTQPEDFDQVNPTSGYTSDLLSCVMAGAANQAIWVTLQAHANIVAVAALLDLSAVIITEGAQPDAETLERAQNEAVTLLSTDKPTFWVVGRLWELGMRSA